MCRNFASLVLLTLVSIVLSMPGNLVFDNSNPMHSGDMLTWAYSSDRDSVWSHIVFDDGDQSYDTIKDPLFFRLLQIDNGTEQEWFGNGGLFPDADSAEGKFLYVIPEAELAVGLYWLVVNDVDGEVYDSFRIAPKNIYRTISGTVTSDVPEHAAFLNVSASSSEGDGEKKQVSAVTDANGNYTIYVDSSFGLENQNMLMVRLSLDAGSDNLPPGLIGDPRDTVVDIENGNLTGVDFRLRQLTSAARIVMKAGGQPIEIGVGLSDSTTNNWVGDGQTNDSGVVTIYCEPGVYRVQYQSERVPGGYLAPNSVYVRVLENTVSEVIVNFTEGDAFIHGRVTQDNGNPPGSYRIRIENSKLEVSAHTVTGTGGYFTLPALQTDSTWQVMFETGDNNYDSVPEGYEISGSRHVQVVLGDSVFFNMVPKAPGAIAGSITNNSSYSPLFYWMALYEVDTTGGFAKPGQMVRSANFPENSTYVFDGISEGEYCVQAVLFTGTNYDPKSTLQKWHIDSNGGYVPISVGTDTVYGINFIFTDSDTFQNNFNNSIDGRVEYNGKYGYETVRVGLWDTLSKEFERFSYVDSNFNFSFKNIHDGTFKIQVFVDYNDDGRADAMGESDVAYTLHGNSTYIYDIVVNLNDLPSGIGVVTGLVSYTSEWPIDDAALSVYIVPLDSGVTDPDREYFDSHMHLAYRTELDSLGNYSIGEIAPGRYVAVANAYTIDGENRTVFANGGHVLADSGMGKLAIIMVDEDTVKDVDIDLAPVMPVVAEEIVKSAEFVLHGASPNPFNPVTTISFSIPSRGFVSLSIVDVTGRLVKKFVNSYLGTGHHKIAWNSTDENGRSVTSGVYICRIEYGKRVLQKKLVLLR